MGEEAIDLFRTLLFPGFLMFYHTFCAQCFYVGVSHIGQRSFTVGAEIFFHLFHNVVNDVNVTHVKVKSLEHRFVAFDQFSSGKSGWITCGLCMVFDDMCNRMDSTMYLSLAEIQLLSRLFLLNGFNHNIQQVCDSFTFRSGNRNNRNT